jgi:hypothetical protein
MSPMLAFESSALLKMNAFSVVSSNGFKSGISGM